MTDTIELLETIGRDASLRHASGETLAQALNTLQASEGLRQAASSGDSRHLAQELGPRTDPPPNHNTTNGGVREGDEDEADDNGLEPEEDARDKGARFER